MTIADNSELSVSARSVAEAKIAIKELKLKKKEYALVKREISQQQKQIRAEYTDRVRQRGSKLRGCGSIGGFVRTVQTIIVTLIDVPWLRSLRPWNGKRMLLMR